jgi:hypothetical protein
MPPQAWHAACVHWDGYRYLKLNDATRILLTKPWGGPMIVQDAFIDAIGGLRVCTTSGRQKGSPRGYPDPRAGGGDILRREDGRKDSSAEAVAAPFRERRWFRRHSQCLPLTMSVFNQGGAFQAQMVSYGQDGICAETGHSILPGTSLHLRIDTREAAEVEKAVLQGLRTTALGEVKWCRALGQGRHSLYRIGIRYYPYY